MKIHQLLNEEKIQIKKVDKVPGEYSRNFAMMLRGNAPILYRGGRPVGMGPMLIIGERKEERVSTYSSVTSKITGNLNEFDERWAAFPKRGFSTMCIPSEQHASDFGQVGIVIPHDGIGRYGVAPDDFNFESSWEAWGEMIGEHTTLADSLRAFRFNATDQFENGAVTSEALAKYYAAELDKDPQELWKALGPEENGFRAVNSIDQIRKQDGEVWFVGPYLFVAKSWFEEQRS